MSVLKYYYLLAKRYLFLLRHGGRFLNNYVKASREIGRRCAGFAVGVIPADVIGPMILFFEAHLRHFQVHHLDAQRDAILITTSKPCNRQLHKMICRSANVVIDDDLFHTFTEGGERVLSRQGSLVAQKFTNGPVFYKGCPSFISFNEDELSYGRSLLKKMGVDASKPLITIHNKDGGYWQSRGAHKEWDAYRDTDFNDLLPTIHYLKSQDFQIIRTGFYTDPPSKDYVDINGLTRDEIDFMDVYLQQQAILSINGDSGIAWLPYLFRKPVLIHNFIPMGESPPVERGLFVPKLMRKKGTKRLMTLREIQEIKHLFGYPEGSRYVIRSISADSFQGSYYYNKYGIEVIDNTPQEVLEAAKEAIQYEKGSLKLTTEDEARQRQFKASFPLQHPMRHTPGIVSPSFLKKYEEILI